MNLAKNQRGGGGGGGMRPSGSNSALNKPPTVNPSALLPPQFDLLAADFNAVLAAAAGGLPPNIDPAHLMAAFAQQLAATAPSPKIPGGPAGGGSLLQQQLSGAGFPSQSPGFNVAATPSPSSLHHSSSHNSLANSNSMTATTVGAVGVKPQSSGARYQQLLSIIDEIGKDIRPVYMGNKNSVERLKRAIASARVLVKDCQIECDRNTKN